MWKYPQSFDVIVIGAGHAGCEACHASAKIGARTLLLTMSLDTIGKMSCNPSIGGTAKGHLVREVDALGGLMGKVTDKTGIQFQMLNRTKGPAIRSPRAQSDKIAYQSEMKYFLEKTPNLSIKQGTIDEIFVENKQVVGVLTQDGVFYSCSSLVIASGTFMCGLIHMGASNISGGRGGEKASKGLSLTLKKLGLSLGRLKTGTPPRINKKSIDYEGLEEQVGQEDVYFSFDEKQPRLPQIPCHITYTNERTHEIIRKNLSCSPMYSGKIQSKGPRYCPSIEDKVVRFEDKPRHQIFLEPEGLSTNEVYVNGISSGLPYDVQLEFIHSIQGLEKADVMRPAYAIEYDYVTSGQIFPSLETRKVNGLFLAGQINGTTGYEEAAAQGLIAGINAANKSLKKESFIPKRSESYIGVMVNDLILKELDEPYRMFTARAEHRLYLRQDNADLRLRHYGYELGLISEEQYTALEEKKRQLEAQKHFLKKTFRSYRNKNSSLAQLLSRPEMSYFDLKKLFPEDLLNLDDELTSLIEIDLKYEGYLLRQEKEIEKFAQLEQVLLPKNFDYEKVKGLKNEAKEKLKCFQPLNLMEASRIGGVTHADISVLLVFLKK